MFKKFILIIAIFFAFVCAVWADINSLTVNSAGFDKLSDAQKVEMLATIAKTVEANDAKNTPTVEDVDAQIQKVDKWVEYGTNIGKGLGGAAKEIGIAANDFAKTPVGILTSVIIAWHFMGDAIGIPIHLFAGVAVFVFGNIILALVVCRGRYEIQYDATRKEIGRTYKPINDEWRAVWLVGAALILIASLITSFTW